MIRRPRPEDAAAMVAIMGDGGVSSGLLQLPHATEAQWRKRIVEMPVGPATAELFIVAERGGEVVGNAGVHPLQHVRRRHAAGISMAVARQFQATKVYQKTRLVLLELLFLLQIPIVCIPLLNRVPVVFLPLIMPEPLGQKQATKVMFASAHGTLANYFAILKTSKLFTFAMLAFIVLATEQKLSQNYQHHMATIMIYG